MCKKFTISLFTPAEKFAMIPFMNTDIRRGTRVSCGVKERGTFVRFLDRLRNALMRFMYGRYGNDRLNQALCVMTLMLCVAEVLLGRVPVLGAVLHFLTTFLWFIVLLRMFSHNFDRRRAENERFLAVLGPLQQSLRQQKMRREDREHKYFTCKDCGAVCRVPRGRGKIIITCPKCGREICGKS